MITYGSFTDFLICTQYKFFIPGLYTYEYLEKNIVFTRRTSVIPLL